MQNGLRPEPMTNANSEPERQIQNKLRLGALVRSDSLPRLLEFAGNLPAFAPLLKDIVRLGVVLDAHVIQQELRWRLGRRKKPDARTGLHEAIASGVLVPFAPTFLDAEIEEHVSDIAEATGVTIEDVRREWQDFRKLLHFYSPKRQPQLNNVVDADDLPYIAAANELGLPIYSQDRHYRQMRAPVISVLIDGTAQSYARSSSVKIAVMMGSTFTVTLSFEAIAAVCRGLKRIGQWFDELHPGVQLAIIAGVIIAFAHPKSRAKLASMWEWVKTTATPPVLQAIVDVAVQLAEANKTADVASSRIKEALPLQRGRSALMHARTICLTARAALPGAEIERRMRAEGYVTRARNFNRYLRRVLLCSGQFHELSPDMWILVF